MPVPISRDVAQALAGAIEGRKGLRVYGELCPAQFRGLRDADAVLIAATLRSCCTNGALEKKPAAWVASCRPLPGGGLGDAEGLSLAAVLRDAGCNASHFPKDLASLLKVCGFSAAELKSAVSTAQLVAVGCTAKELLDGGLALKELEEHGLGMECVGLGAHTAESLRQAGSAAVPADETKAVFLRKVDSLKKAGSFEALKDAPKFDIFRQLVNDANGYNLFWHLACVRPTTLLEMNLARNGLKAKAVGALASFLRYNATVTSVDLHDNCMADEGAASIGAVLAQNSTLENIRVSSNEIGPAGAAAIVEGLRHNTQLKAITLDTGAGVTSPGIPLEKLKGTEACHKLDLAGMHFGMASGVAIAQLIQTYRPEINTLQFDRNPILDEGVSALAEMLKTNNSISELHFRFTAMGPAGATALAAALKVNTSVQRVFMLANQVGDEGAKALGEMLAASTTLKCFALEENRISPEGKASIVKLCEGKPGLDVYV